MILKVFGNEFVLIATMSKTTRIFIVTALLAATSLARSPLTIENGVYSRLSVNVQDQDMPNNCQAFLDRLESVINYTSHGLHSLTDGRGQFGDIHVFLPKSWDIARCQGNHRPIEPRSQLLVSEADLNVHPDPSWSGSEAPWTEQHGGCGVQGLKIQVPIGYFDEKYNQSEILLREFCKYRYGVFPETGFQDKIYPHLYNEGNTTLLSTGCPLESQANLFCPVNGTYNRHAPTKQNLLCGHQSAMEVILNHSDLNVNNASEKHDALFQEPRFKYFVPKASRYSIVLERTSMMDMNDRWTHIKRAMFRFLQHLPVGTEVNIVTFGKEAKVNLPPTILTNTNREGLHGRIPRKVLDDNLACIYCALNTSFKNLGQEESGTIILVTGSARPPQAIEKLMETVSKVPLRIFPIVYPGTGNPSLTQLAKYGKHYYVHEGSNLDTAMSPLSYLNEILLDILQKSEGMNIQKIHETRHNSYEFAGTFTIEEDMMHKMTVTLNVDDEEKVEFFEVTNPSGDKKLFSKFEDGMVILNHPGIAQAGIWTYHAKLYSGAALPKEKMSVDVVSQSKDSSSKPFLLDVFTNVDGVEEVDIFKQPVIIYARLTQGSHSPVLNARVVARIHRPGSEMLEIRLRDNGSGNPDITALDGIYSGYLTELARVPGYYSVEVVADHNQGLARTVSSVQVPDQGIETNCCGSRVPHPSTAPSAAFKRQSAGPSVYLRQGLPPKTDLAPPTQVLDFHVARIVENSLYVQLEWSAPGGDYDQGKASKYEIRCYTTREAFVSESTFKELGILVHDSFTPEPAPYGQTQTSTVGVPWPNEVFYYAIVAIDEAGNRSPISNVISVYISEEQAASTEAPLDDEDENVVVDKGDDARPLVTLASSEMERGKRSEQLKIYIASGVVAGLILLVALITAVITIRSRIIRRSEYDAEDKDTYKAYEPADKKDGGVAKPVSTWLDSLPRSTTETNNGISSHETSVDMTNTTGTLNRKSGNNNNHTLTKTNPYRHKVLTNGSFLNLKDIPCNGSNHSSGSSQGDQESSRPTTSTEDNHSQSSESGEYHQQQQQLTQQLNQQLQQHFSKKNISNIKSSRPSIDSSSAKAIIDTYTNRLPHYYPHSQMSDNDFTVEVLPPPSHTTLSSLVVPDDRFSSLQHPQHYHYPPHHYPQHQTADSMSGHGSLGHFRSRTESVV